ncbi:MAG: PAS domain S-box protein [Gemmatimonadetes bacterium]|nr:PAS domain S-box protein [Gemmatimonadota bacterium]
MNLNKLFPRLTIRAKLAIAFALLAVVPLAAVVAVTTGVTTGHLHAGARAALRHEVERSRAQMERSLAQLESDVAYLAYAVLGPLLDGAPAADWRSAARLASSFLAAERTLFRVQLVDADGRVLLARRAPDGGAASAEQPEAEAVYYAWRAQSAERGRHLLLPVELRGGGVESDGARPIPAVAVLIPLRTREGELRGVVVGEARAAELFAHLDLASPTLPGVTGLVDATGLYLYHSARKRDWSSLLASNTEVSLRRDFPAAVVAQVLSGRAGTSRTSDARLVSFVPLSLPGSAIGPLTLYRAVPLAAVAAPARRYLESTALMSLPLMVLVLGLAVVAGHQFTQPIYQLRQAARRLARGGAPPALDVATNDELEDLAADFTAMATSLVSHRRRLEELLAERSRALQHKHAELADILAHSADAIVGLGLDRRVRVWNGGAERLFGYRADEATGRDIQELLGPRTAGAEREAAFLERELAERGEVVNYQTSRLARDGRLLPVSLTQTLIRGGDGRPVGYSLILRDTGAQARLEAQMRRSERLAAVSVMAAGLAHELNNPLAVISNRLECMERDARERCGDCFLERDLDVLREHTARLGALTADLLRFAGDGAGEPGPVDVAEVATRVVGLLERTFAARHIRLEFCATRGLAPVFASGGGLETVCMNLLLNAAEATPAGGCVTIEVRPSAQGDSVELRVADSGPGVAPELRERVFEAFFTTKGGRGGTGLGLAVCRSVIERCGGRIWVEGGAGEGARFVVSLPFTWLEG